MTRPYHKVAAQCIIFYVDATGGLFDKVQNAGKISYYAMVLPHPFSRGPPIAVTEMIANKHTADLIRRMFQELRYRERLIYKSTGNSQPMGIMTDFSLAIIIAAIAEYMVGKACREDLNGLFIFTCAGHMMKNIKKHAKVAGGIECNSKVHQAIFISS